MGPDIIENRADGEGPRRLSPGRLSLGRLSRGRGAAAIGALALVAGLAVVLAVHGGHAHPAAATTPTASTSTPPVSWSGTAIPVPAESAAGVPEPTAPGNAGPVARLPVPPIGGVGGGRLADGTFVYVVRTSATRARVLDAVSPAGLGGLGVEVGWCASAGVFVDPWSGSAFDKTGRLVAGPAPKGLGYRAARVVGRRLVVGPHRGAGRPALHMTSATGCDSIRYAQNLLRIGVTNLADIAPPAVTLTAGVITVSRAGEVRICDGFADRGDCGTSGYALAGVSDFLAGGHYPWVLARAGYGRLGADGRLHDFVLVGDPRQQHVKDDGTRHVLVRHVSGRTIVADPVDFLMGDAANQAAAEAHAEVPIPDDYYVVNATEQLHRYRLRSDATLTVVDLAHNQYEKPVDLAHWTRIVNAHDRPELYVLSFDAAGEVTAVREQFVP